MLGLCCCDPFHLFFTPLNVLLFSESKHLNTVMFLAYLFIYIGTPD